MAKMLLRTNSLHSKFRIAFYVRCILFFGIPSFYYIFLRDNSEINVNLENDFYNDPEYSENYQLNGFSSFSSSRKLLGILEPGRNCTHPAILEFPSDGLTRWQRKHGFIAIHCIIAMYCFLLLGNVCEQYFVPAIKLICDKLSMAEDIAGATFMAAASSSPELFINCVGTFVTKGDLGVGTVVGSAVFNVLAVPACCGLLAGQVVELDWWCVSRDCLMYGLSVVALILTLQDDRVYWYEALVLVSAYTFYILAMYFNEGLGKFFKSGCCTKSKVYSEVTPLLIKEKNGALTPKIIDITDPEKGVELQQNDDQSSDLESSVDSLWSWPNEKKTGIKKLLWVLTWPIGLLLWATIPDCSKRQRLYPLTFIMCVFWIGGVSYLVAWLITVIGDTLEIPDSITGLTVLAAGTSLPEAVSSVIVTNQGHGSMGISNSIGSNTFDILLCLGLPWLVKSVFYPSTPGNNWVSINSSGLSYNAVSLLSTLLALYLALLFNKFCLDWRTGLVCIIIYLGFIAVAALIELNFFFPVNLPVCPH